MDHNIFSIFALSIIVFHVPFTNNVCFVLISHLPLNIKNFSLAIGRIETAGAYWLNGERLFMESLREEISSIQKWETTGRRQSKKGKPSKFQTRANMNL